jgi:2-iminobutanoate/2-iminopropanoate deaminase
MKKQIIQTSKAPLPIGPYSQAVQFGHLLFVSGQIPLNPESGDLELSDIATETRMVMENIHAVLAEAGYGFEHIIKATIFLTDMADFAAVNDVYGEYFQSEPPARECVQVAGLPRNVHVEISVIAAKA